MNVERLHRVIFDFQNDLQKTNLLGNLQAVRENLQNIVNQPNQPAYQTNLVASIEELNKALHTSKYNSYTPMFKETIAEITNEMNFGEELKSEIDSIFASNIITPAKALEDIDKIVNEIIKIQTGITNTIGGLESLNIEKEELEPGTCELGYTIPRKYIDNKLVELKNEISELNFILNMFTEAVTGKTEDHKVKTISSSEFLLYVILGLQVADAVSKATERILNHYKQILEIKVLRNQLAEKGVPAKETASVEKYANGLMETEIKKIAKEIIDEHYNEEKGRKNEIENGLNIALNKLANRIDNGFSVEIRVEPLPKPKTEDKDEQYESNVELIKSIQKSANNIDYIEAKGKAILQLPESVEKN
ncbi:hypothetical protein SAMN05444377_1062 [Flavobacterium fontis]|uniref:Uncharacterized protein n=1 Tax=Flavobacterium fontis TaxID=1124188 RepID=A0A1M5AC32_9FLAO|nr:hypothetical protein [Flavobacterium fontis]SHF27596.1 hypothetical protein SAMN05444377_1062 [Flavobacterium fontis]